MSEEKISKHINPLTELVKSYWADIFKFSRTNEPVMCPQEEHDHCCGYRTEEPNRE